MANQKEQSGNQKELFGFENDCQIKKIPTTEGIYLQVERAYQMLSRMNEL